VKISQQLAKSRAGKCGIFRLLTVARFCATLHSTMLRAVHTYAARARAAARCFAVLCSLFSFTAVSMVLRHRTSPTTSGVSPTSVRGGACARRQHPLSSFLHRGCPPSATVPFRGRGASVEQSAGFRHGVNVAAHVQATPEDCTVREKLLNTGRREHLPSHVILLAFNFVRCPCSRSDIMPP